MTAGDVVAFWIPRSSSRSASPLLESGPSQVDGREFVLYFGEGGGEGPLSIPGVLRPHLADHEHSVRVLPAGRGCGATW